MMKQVMKRRYESIVMGSHRRDTTFTVLTNISFVDKGRLGGLAQQKETSASFGFVRRVKRWILPS
jgi:hypothetical protein